MQDIKRYLERSLRRLSTSCKASLPAAWLPQQSVALARWLVSRLETCRARPECTASADPPVEEKKQWLLTSLYTTNHFTWQWEKARLAFIHYTNTFLQLQALSQWVATNVFIPSTFSHSMHRLASTWKAAQAMVATFCFFVCFSLELQSLWPLKLHRLSISWTSPLRTRHCSSLL